MGANIYKRSIALLCTLCLLLSGCGSRDAQQDTDKTTGEAVQETQSAVVAQPEEQKADKTIYMDASRDIETRIEALLAQMTLEEKAAQMVQPEQQGISVADVKKYGFGSALSGGGSAPSYGNTPADWQKRVNELKQAATESRLGIPLLYGIDAVHGNNNVYGTVIFPHNIGLGAAGDMDLIERIGTAVAAEVRATGVQWTFAPTLGNPQNERWGRTYECFSERAEDVVDCGAAYIRGFQGKKGTQEYLDEEHILACAKHYIGEGYAENGVNQGKAGDTF